MNTTQKGDIAELRIATDLVERGYEVAFPYGVSHDYDLLVNRGDGFERVQVKYAEIKNGVIPVRSRSHSNTSVKQVQKNYTADMIDWIAVYEPTTHMICYVSSSELGGTLLHLRVDAPKKRHPSIRWASEYQDLGTS